MNFHKNPGESEQIIQIRGQISVESAGISVYFEQIIWKQIFRCHPGQIRQRELGRQSESERGLFSSTNGMCLCVVW